MNLSLNGPQIPDDLGTPAIPIVPKRRSWHRSPLFWVLLLACAVGGLFAAPVMKRRLVQWNETRRLERAEGFFMAAEFDRAILDARGVLESNPAHVEANRLIARSLEKAGSPAALSWRIRLQTLRADDVENSLALAKGALDAGDIALTTRTIEKLKSDANTSAVFHEVSARLAKSRGDAKSAEIHWQEACRIEPGELRYRMSLGAHRLEAKEPEVRASAVATLREIAGNPEYSARALRILLAEARKYAHPARVRELADEVVAAPGASFEDKLTRLEILRGFDTPDSASYLEELRAAAQSDPEDFYQLLVWMNQNDLAMVASEWFAAMPPESLAKTPICIGVAQIYTKGAEWEKLREMTGRGGLWGGMDYLRRAFLARALERLGQVEESVGEWKNAVSAAPSARDTSQRLERLAIMAQSWRWQQRQEDILWRIARLGGAPRWVLDALWRFASARSNTDQLQEIAGYVAKNAPGDVAARNNYNFLCLLTRSQEGNPHHESEVLYRNNSGHSAVAVTYALSLYQQGSVSEAIAITSGIQPEDLRKPGGPFAFYHGVFLIAGDRGEEASEFLELAGNRQILAEEKAILEREKDFAKKRAEQELAEAAQRQGQRAGAIGR